MIKRLSALLITIVLICSVSLVPAQASGDLVDGGDPQVAIAEAKAADPVGFENKVQVLRSSNALMALFTGAPDEETVTTYLEFFALNSSTEQVQAFVDDAEGKHFVVTGTLGDHSVALVDGEPITPYGSCCACWRAWVASAAYFAGSGLLCGAVGFGGAFISGGVGAVAGFSCGGVFWAIEKLPNFDSAC